MYKGIYTRLARTIEVKYQPINSNRLRTIKFDKQWDLLWDPIKKILYGIKKSTLNKARINKGLENHPAYKMVRVFKDQDVDGAFEALLKNKPAYQKLGKAIHVVYKSDKWNKGKYYDYIHEFGEDGYVVLKNHGVNIYYDPENRVYEIKGGKLDVDERGIIF